MVSTTTTFLYYKLPSYNSWLLLPGAKSGKQFTQTIEGFSTETPFTHIYLLLNLLLYGHMGETNFKETKKT
jgi:hypothetical protein